MAGRPRKDGVVINYYIRKDLKDKLDEYSKLHEQTNTQTLEVILDLFFEHEKKRAEAERIIQNADPFA